MAGISSPGIGSGLDVNSIVSKLMSVESAPLTAMDKQTASYQAKLSALGTLSGAVSTFQGSLSGLLSLTGIQSLTSTSTDTSVLVGAATGTAKAGSYKVNVSQVAQAQTLAAAGRTSSSAAIGVGATTTVSFQFGAVSGGSFGVNGGALADSVASGGITPGALTINNTRIATDSSVKSAKLLADAINAKSATTGVSASATTSTSATLFGAAGASTFGAVDTSAGGTYALSVGGVQIASQAAGVAAGDGVTAASLDTILADTNGSVFKALEAAGISVNGLASDGTLRFTSADGANIVVAESVTGDLAGGIGNDGSVANTGSSVTASGTLALVSADASQIRIGGTNPGAAGLTAGSAGAYLGASFAQDGTKSSGSVVIDSTNNSLEGIRDAINKANFGVSATIVNDGSGTPYHLVLSSTQTGAASSMKISLSGSGGNPADPALVSLLDYDPAGTQNLSQNASAQSTLLNVNGIDVRSETTSVAGAIEGVTLTIGTPGAASLVVAKDSSSLNTAVNGFVKAYNDLNNQIKTLTGYNADTKVGGPLLGDSTAQALQSQVRRAMSQSISGLSGNLSTLSQIGIGFQKDGSLALDSSKLQKAITNNFTDIAGLFAAVGKSSDTQVTFSASTSATKGGSYALHISSMASQGSMTGGAPLAASTVIANDTIFNVTLNDTDPSTANRTAPVTIPAGSYTPTQMASMLQSAINGVSAFSSVGSAVTATVEADGSLKLVSNTYGSKSNILISDNTGTSVADLFFGAAPAAGADVAGTIGGYAATGDGQSLTGAPGGPAEGLKLDVTGGAAGARGTISFSQGYAYQLNNLTAGFLGAKGTIAGRTNGLNQSIKDIGKQSDAFSAKLVDIEKRYRAQYTALDTMIASMNTTTSFLTQQFAAMAKNN
jgi:flagellar hook-associated protein 2